MLTVLIKILCEEKVLFSIPGLELILFLAEGDMRRLLNDSDMLNRSFHKINNQTVKISCFFPDIFNLVDFLFYVIHKNTISALEIFMDIYNNGFGFIEIIHGILKIIKKFQIDKYQKIQILRKICDFQIEFFVFKSDINSVISLIKNFNHI